METSTKPILANSDVNSYFEQRIYIELGVLEEQNRIDLITIYKDENRRIPFEGRIFSEDDHGNIRILVWNLNRETIELESNDASPMHHSVANGRQKTWYITRLKNPLRIQGKDGEFETVKYIIPKGAGTYPFIPPGLVDKFEKKSKIKTLILTEGYFKAFKGYMHGLDIVGLSSISHYRQKETQMMYSDVIRIIHDCKVENVILLYDGDCLNISSSALENGTDLYKRPFSFFNSARNIADLLKDLDVSVYWAMINSAEITENPKGLDDLLIQFKGRENEITDDILKLSKPSQWVQRLNITQSTVKLHKKFHLTSANVFYDFHADQILMRDFVFNGTKYRYNDESGEIEIVMPGAARNYFRVGDVYFEFVKIPNQYGQLETYFHKRKKETIVQDFGRNFIKHIPKYKAFCNVPDNVNYQQVIHNCFNVFHPFSHLPEEGECKKTLSFLKHIFQEHFDLGLDYIQLLLQQPTQILPILCLVSKENSTGKSTFGYYLKELFGANMSIVGNAELQDQFNGAWATKLIVCCDEAFIEKKVVIERIKMLSTARKITLRMMQRDGEEIDFFGKFILISNNEENFIYATDEDIRYWVRKVPSIPFNKVNPNLMNDLVDEIPFFLHFLYNRQLTTQKSSRMWFSSDELETDALRKVREFSKPKAEKTIASKIREMFLDFGDENILLGINEVNKLFFNSRFDNGYLERILKENIGVTHYRNEKGDKVVKRYSYPRWQEVFVEGMPRNIRVDVSMRGRPYVFEREKFLSIDDLNTKYEEVS